MSDKDVCENYHPKRQKLEKDKTPQKIKKPKKRPKKETKKSQRTEVAGFNSWLRRAARKLTVYL